MKKVVYILVVLLVYSCNHSENKTKTNEVVEVISEKNDTISNNEVIEEDFVNDFDILLVREYRDWQDKNEVDKLNKEWLELYKKDEKYYLGKVDYTIERGYSECSGDSTKMIDTQNSTILLIDNLSLQLGEIQSLKIEKNKIWPNEKFTFNFNNQEYTLRAEGKIISSEKIATDNGEELYQQVEDYKLYISFNNSPETLFLEQKSFNDTFVEILFIGDIDKDGKADFIFEANRDYEEERVLLFMSKKEVPIKKVSQVEIHFDC